MLGGGSVQFYQLCLRAKTPSLSGPTCQTPDACSPGQSDGCCVLLPIPAPPLRLPLFTLPDSSGSGCFCGKTRCDLPHSHTHWAQASLLQRAKFHTSIKTAGSQRYFSFWKTARVWLKCFILVIAIRCSCFAHASSNGIGFDTGEQDLMGLGKRGIDDKSQPRGKLPLANSPFRSIGLSGLLRFPKCE